MKLFYVKDLQKLQKFGFYLFNNKGDYLLRNQKRVWCARVNEKDHLMTLFSPSRDTIAILCEMYKQGVFEIVDDNCYTNLKLSEEEYEIICEYRQQKLNESEVKKDERN